MCASCSNFLFPPLDTDSAFVSTLFKYTMVLSLLLSLVLMVTVFLGALNVRHVRCRRDMYDMGRFVYNAISFPLPTTYSSA